MNDLTSPARSMQAGPNAATHALPYAPLEHLGVLKVHGNDAPTFLQGQLSNDILSLPAGQARLAGYLTPNGRLLATFWVLRHDAPPEAGKPDEPVFWMVCARDLAAPMAKRLSMYVLRAKCRVRDMSDNHQLLGFVGATSRAARALTKRGIQPVVAELPEVQITETTADLLTTPAKHQLAPGRLLVRSLLVVPRPQAGDDDPSAPQDAAPAAATATARADTGPADPSPADTLPADAAPETPAAGDAGNAGSDAATSGNAAATDDDAASDDGDVASGDDAPSGDGDAASGDDAASGNGDAASGDDARSDNAVTSGNVGASGSTAASGEPASAASTTPSGDTAAAADGTPPRSLPASAEFRFTEADWLQLDVASGVPWITAATTESFVPQMLNLELAGGVSFKKGCYPGQEVVARSEYRGKVKRRMFAGMCSGPLPEAGTDVLAWDGSPIGQVICVARLSADTDDEALASGDGQPDYNPDELPITLVGRRFLLLFEARLEAVGAQPRLAGMIATSLRIGNAAIGLLQLPYPLPEG
ncbi:hypothetical protein [Lautropia dentalis]